MAYIDKINKNSTDYDLQDSKAARSVNGTTDSHVEQADEIYTTSTQVSTSAFVYRTTAGDVSIETGAASINYLEGNTIQTGHTDEVLDVESAFADSGTTVAIDASTWRTAVSADGAYNFSYDGSDWKLDDATVTLATYGLTVTGTVTEGDTITVTYVALVIGTLATTTPTSFVATGFNQYDATAGYAHVVGNNQYRIAGTYTSLGFTTTIGGATTPVTVTNNKFTPTEDGYIYVTGASGDILIALVWSGTMDSEPYSAYSTSSITIPTADASSTALPTASYGMPSVGNVRDKLSFAERIYVQNIGHYTYSVANLATVQALGVAYVYDLSDIFYVLPEPVTYTLANTVSGAYTANDYGTEEFIGTTVPVNTSITYGNSLVDKLRNMLPIQSIGTGLTLTGTVLSADGGGGGGMITLTTKDYDYPANNPDRVALWQLDAGLYYLPNISGGFFVGFNTSDGKESWSKTCVMVVDGVNNGTEEKYIFVFVQGKMLLSRTQSNGTKKTRDVAILQASDIYADPSTKYRVQIGNNATTSASGTAIGNTASSSAMNAICLSGGQGNGASVSGIGGIRIGEGGYVSGAGGVSIGIWTPNNTVQGKFEIGTTVTSYGYNNSNYRLLTGVYDGQSAHDAVNLGQIIPTTDSSAPTSATAGRLGEIRIDTTDDSAYMCVVSDSVTPTYSWKKITA